MGRRNARGRSSGERWAFIAFLLICLVVSTAPFANAQSERLVTAGAEDDYPPFSFVDEEGEATGFSVELMRRALESMDRRVTFRTGPWSEVKGWLEKGEVQALPLVGRTPEREPHFDFTFPYMSLHGAIVVRKDNREIEDLDDLKGLQVAVMKGDNAEEFLRREDRGIEIHATPTFEDALRELSAGRYDAVVMQRIVALRLIQNTGIKNLHVIDKPVEGFRQDFCFAVPKGEAGTLSLLNEGLSIVMADGTYRHLHARWFAALQQPTRRRIVVGGDHNFPPFEYLNDKGQPTGFAVDLTRAIASEMGMDIEISLEPWTEVRRALAKGEMDALQGMFYSAERDLSFDFSATHAVVNYVAVVRSDAKSVPTTTDDLSSLGLAVQRDDIMHDFVRENDLGRHVSAFDSQEEALLDLSDGRHDCALVARMTAFHIIKKHGLQNLEVGPKPLLSPQYSYAVPDNEKALLAQFSEGLRLIEESGEYREIYDKWLGIYEDPSPSLLDILRWASMILAPLVLLLLLALLWVWSLRRQVGERTADLRASLEYQRAMIACSPVALFSIDPEGKVLTWNTSAERVFGWKAEDVTGKPLPIVPEDKQEEFALLRREVVSGKGFVGKELIRQRKDGTNIPISLSVAPIYGEDGSTVGIMSVAQDITEQKRRDQHILRLNSLLYAIRNVNQITVQENNLGKLTGKVCDSLIQTRAYSGCAIAFLDEKTEQISIVARAGEESFHSDWKTLPADQDEGPGCIREMFRLGEVVIRKPSRDCGSCRYKDNGGEHTTATVPLTYDGKVVGLLHIHVEPEVEIDSEEKALLEEVARDIAFARSKILADRRLHHAQQQIIEQERHRALSTMASGIAHDFNNALSTILGFTDLLLQSREKLANRDTAVRYLEMIQKAASNAAETVKRMRKFYRPLEDNVMKAVDMNDLITEALSMTRPRWEDQARAAGAEIIVEKNLGKISKLQGNEAELHEMLSNLIFNAVEAMPDGGTLEVKTRQEDDNIVVEFKDTGTGMHENVRIHCLEPFFTTKQETGTGLGLATVHGTVKRHGGSINAESTPGKGTTFRIRLPAKEHCDESQSDIGSTPKPDPLSILVIEDAEDQRRMLAEYLAIDEHRVDTVPNGEEGLHAFMQGDYDLVITDRSMPKMRGDEVVAKIKAIDPEKPIIMLTGFGDMMEATDEMVEHVDVLLSKPVELKEFRSAILKAMGKNRE